MWQLLLIKLSQWSRGVKTRTFSSFAPHHWINHVIITRPVITGRCRYEVNAVDRCRRKWLFHEVKSARARADCRILKRLIRLTGNGRNRGQGFRGVSSRFSSSTRTMSAFLPVCKTVVIGSSDYQSLLDDVRLIHVGLIKKEDATITSLSKKI